VTLSTLFLFRGLGTWLTESRQLDFPEEVRSFGQAAILGVPVPILIFAGVALLAHVVLRHTSFGRHVYAFGNDPLAARKAGLPVRRIEAAVYVISGTLAALAGFILIAQIGRLDTGFGEGREFDVIAAAVLGGASLFGGVGGAGSAVLGALTIQAVKAGLVFAGVNLYLQPLLQGAVILMAVFLDGLAKPACAPCVAGSSARGPDDRGVDASVALQAKAPPTPPAGSCTRLTAQSPSFWRWRWGLRRSSAWSLRTSLGSIVGLRPLYTPFSLAAWLPSIGRSRLRLVPNSAKTPSMSRKASPAAVAVSAGCSVARKATSLPFSSWTMSWRSLSQRARRSMPVTTSVSPARRNCMSRSGSGRPSRDVLMRFSARTIWQPAARTVAFWMARSWSVVGTQA
jgi:hypothetical protein